MDLLQYGDHTHFLEYADAVVAAGSIAAQRDARMTAYKGRDIRHAVRQEHIAGGTVDELPAPAAEQRDFLRREPYPVDDGHAVIHHAQLSQIHEGRSAMGFFHLLDLEGLLCYMDMKGRMVFSRKLPARLDHFR